MHSCVWFTGGSLETRKFKKYEKKLTAKLCTPPAWNSSKEGKHIVCVRLAQARAHTHTPKAREKMMMMMMTIIVNFNFDDFDDDDASQHGGYVGTPAVAVLLTGTGGRRPTN